MRSVLIVNLKRNGDILYMAHTINAIKFKYPDAHISALVFEEFSKCAKMLKKVNSIFCIDRRSIVATLKNKIYSDHFAINHLCSILSSIDKMEWDIIFNYSNDKASSYITSFLTSENRRKAVGIKIDSTGPVAYSNQWSELFNEFIVEYQQVPSPFAHYYCQMISSKFTPPLGDDLLENRKHRKEVEKQFAFLKKRIGKDAKIVGINMCASHHKKSITKEKIVNIIDRIQEEGCLIPIIIHSPSNQEKGIAQNILKRIRNRVVSIECDFIAAISVIRQLDILITPDTALKHIADLVCTPCVEVSLAEAPIFKQSTLLSNSLILSAPIYERSFLRSKSDDSISPHDIVSACLHILFGKKNEKFSDGVVLYKPSLDALGPYLHLIYGKSNIFNEITRVALRILTYQIFSQKRETSEYKCFLRYDECDIREWARPHREDNTRDIESVQSIIKIIKENNDSARKDFLLELDLLLDGSNYFSLSGLCLSIFRGRTENMTQKSQNENLKEFHNNLEILKTHLLMAHSLIHRVEKIHHYSTKKSAQQWHP